MTQKLHSHNIWSKKDAKHWITEALQLLEKADSERHNRYFSQTELRKKVLEIGTDKHDNRLEWKVIKSTFYVTLKLLVEECILESMKKKRMSKSDYSFYRLNIFKDEDWELKKFYKQEKLDRVIRAFETFPIYYYEPILTTGISLKGTDKTEFIKKFKKIREKLRESWIEKEINTYLKSVIDFFNKPNKIRNENAKAEKLGYWIHHLLWWLRTKGEDKNKYRSRIDKQLNVNAKIKEMAIEYSNKIEQLYEDKCRGIDEVKKRFSIIEAKEPNLTSDIDDLSGAATLLETVWKIVEEVRKEGMFTDDEARLVRIETKMGIKFSRYPPPIYRLPRFNPIVIIDI